MLADIELDDQEKGFVVEELKKVGTPQARRLAARLERAALVVIREDIPAESVD